MRGYNLNIYRILLKFYPSNITSNKKWSKVNSSFLYSYNFEFTISSEGCDYKYR